MNHKITTFILIFPLLIFVGSCASSKTRYFDLLDEMSDALRMSDSTSVLNISNSISEKEILSKNGIDFLKLKIMGLTFAGDYETVYLVLNEYLERFAFNPELLLAEGIMAEKTSRSGNLYFEKAITILENKPIETSNETDSILEFYLLLILDKPELMNKKNRIYASLSTEEKGVADHYLGLTREELLSEAPIGFVASKSLPEKKNIPTNGAWW